MIEFINHAIELQIISKKQFIHTKMVNKFLKINLKYPLFSSSHFTLSVH